MVSFIKTTIACAAIAFFTAACQQAPSPESNNGLSYGWGTTIPVDSSFYTISGTVVTDAESLVRQSAPAQMQSYSYEGASLATLYGPELNGKGMVRLQVTASDSELAPIDSTVILKMDDTKGVLLRTGDQITVKCRAQFEAIAPVMKRQTFNPAAGVWELDYCRLSTPVVQSGKVAK